MSKPFYAAPGVTVFHGDCIEMMRTLPDESVHAVVTDPPYGIRFMGQAWDGADIEKTVARGRENSPMPEGVGGPRGGYRSAAAEAGRYNQTGAANRAFQEWCESWAAEAWRVLKPGGHMLVSGSSRTWHRLTAGIEDAGFEIRDSIAWLYGSGLPKSMNVAKAIASGGGRPEDIRRMQMGDAYEPSGRGRVNYDHGGGSAMNGRTTSTSELPDAAREWDGWGTALKPAFEPIVVARKPLVGTVAANVLAYGTGAINIDATRTHSAGSEARAYTVQRMDPGADQNRNGKNHQADVTFEGGTKAGRWPTNVVLDESQASTLDEQSGTLTSGLMPPGTPKRGKARGILGEWKPQESTSATYGDSGGASRFFPTFRYEAKAPQSERPDVDGVQHPTVKPLDLMRWLVKLVTPPGGTVLEPFAGSGTTVEACLREGFTCIAIEREATYLPLIMQRIRKDHEQSLFGDDWEGES